VLIDLNGGCFMRDIVMYLNDLKEKFGSDYRTAKMMDVERTVISTIRKRNAVSDENAMKMADLLGIEREKVLIAAAIARSKGDVRAMWEKVSRMAGYLNVAFYAISGSWLVQAIISTGGTLRIMHIM
jgi:hypothetical protein